jgi:hypothetical protein
MNPSPTEAIAEYLNDKSGHKCLVSCAHEPYLHTWTDLKCRNLGTKQVPLPTILEINLWINFFESSENPFLIEAAHFMADMIGAPIREHDDLYYDITNRRVSVSHQKEANTWALFFKESGNPILLDLSGYMDKLIIDPPAE